MAKQRPIKTTPSEILEHWRGARNVEASRCAAKEAGDDPDKHWKHYHYYDTTDTTGLYTDTTTGKTYKIDECHMGADISELHSHCWRCGCEWRNYGSGRMERAHLFPRQFEDAYTLSANIDDPCNIILLCSFCHKEAPDTKNPKDTFDWMRETHVPSYNTFWNLKLLQGFSLRAKRLPEMGHLATIVYIMQDKEWMRGEIKLLEYFMKHVESINKFTLDNEKKSDLGEGLGIHFTTFSEENCYILLKRQEEFWFNKIKEAKKTLSKIELKLFKKRCSKFWANDSPIDFSKGIEGALVPAHMRPLNLQKPDLPSWLPKIEQILR